MRTGKPIALQSTSPPAQSRADRSAATRRARLTRSSPILTPPAFPPHLSPPRHRARRRAFSRGLRAPWDSRRAEASKIISDTLWEVLASNDFSDTFNEAQAAVVEYNRKQEEEKQRGERGEDRRRI